MAASSNLSPQEMEQRLGAERRALGETIDTLRHRLRVEMTPRQQIRKHTDAVIGASLVAGFLTARILRRLFF